MKTFDVVIGGGGMVGMTLAIALAQGGLRVALADPLSKVAVLDTQFDGRVSALAYAAVRMLQTLGVWAHLEGRTQPINDILVTDATALGKASRFSLHFDAVEISAKALGVIAENRHLRASLFAVAETLAGIEFFTPAAISDLSDNGDHIIATLSNAEQISARLAVAADGRQSPMREKMDLPIVAWSYPQWGIVTTVEHERPHNGVAYEHFLPSGPFAILPLTPVFPNGAGDVQINRSSLVWTERADLTPQMMSLPDAQFDTEIALRFGNHLGATRATGPRWSYPLNFHLARMFVKPRFALAGDAAHGIHPIAGQGLNLGLKDAAALAEIVLDTARLGLDIGSLASLKRYERWRRFDCLALSVATDGLNRLFSNHNTALRLLRDAGMGLVDAFGPARRFFMRHAGGDVGKLPRLMKGEAA